jgi:predicted RND superfamily exporter protein
MRLFHRPLLVAVLHVVTHPKRALSIALIVLAGCLGLAYFRLNISTDQNRLFDPTVPFFRDFLRFGELFPENEALYIVVERARPADPEPPVRRWTQIADDLAARLRTLTSAVHSVDAKVPVERLGTQGLLFDSHARVQQAFADVKRFVPLAKLWAEEPNSLTRLLGTTPIERFVTALRAQPIDTETAGFVKLLADSWNEALAHPDQPLTVGAGLPDLAAADASDPSRLGYYYVPDESNPKNHLLLVRVYPDIGYQSLTEVSEKVGEIRAAVEAVTRQYPEFKVGLSGRPALEADEMRTTDADSNKAEIVALIAVFIGLAVVLRSMWLALAGEIALCVGIGWTFGWATVSIGELNLLSIVFFLALIGIGMDYLVQILTRYRLERSRRAHPATIWIGVFRHVAAPINTACLGAAGAFLVSALTRFRGAAQLGIIAGGGLLLCLVSGYVVLPALLTLFPGKPAPREDILNNLSGAGRTPARGSLWPPVVWAILLAAGIGFAQTEFDPGLLKLQAPNLESVKLISKLQTWSAVVLTKDLTVLGEARRRLHESPQISHTESILIAYDNLDWLRAHEAELPAVNWSTPQDVRPQDLASLATKTSGLADAFATAKNEEAADSLRRFSRTMEDAGGDDATRVAARLSQWQRAFVDQLKELLAQFHPADLRIDQLPQELRSHYVADDGTFALYAYPKGNLWHQSELRAFSRDVEPRMQRLPGDRTLTGIAIDIYHSTAYIERAFYQATGYALGLIFLLVLIDLRSFRQTFLAISVLALGLPMLTAAMGVLDWMAQPPRYWLQWIGLNEVTWNFANFFGLPILIGAGHEYGVFLVHRYREAVHDPRRVWRRWDVSDRALALCAYVTCSSFGFFFILAHHRGLRSLGLVMALGTASIYLAAVLVLRPLLLWHLELGSASADRLVRFHRMRRSGP